MKKSAKTAFLHSCRTGSLLAFLILPLSLGAALPSKVSWDFRRSDGKHPGGKLEKEARITPRGLIPTGKNLRLNSGFSFDEGVIPSPEGAFRLTIGFVPGEKGRKYRYNFHQILFDSMKQDGRRITITDNGGIQLSLLEYTRDMYAPVARFGFGSCKAEFFGTPVKLPADKAAEIVLEYDALSKARILVNGREVGLTTVSGVPLPGRKSPFVGNRGHSREQYGFLGALTYGSLEYLPQPEFAMAVTGNRVFYRGRKNAVKLEFRAGEKGGTFSGLSMTGLFGGVPVEGRKITADKEFSVDIESRLRPGKYPLKFTISGKRNGRDFRYDGSIDLHIVAEPPANRMAVRMWMDGGNQGLPERITRYGYTDLLFNFTEHLPIEKLPETVINGRISQLDMLCLAGVQVMDSLDITNYRIIRSVFPGNRILDRDGKPRPVHSRQLPDANRQEVIEAMTAVAETAGKIYGTHPVVNGTLINTERRDHIMPGLDPVTNERYRKASGQDIPAEVDLKLSAHYNLLSSFPADRVLPEDDRLLTYYKWFWKVGDGMNNINSAMSDAYKRAAGGKELTTMYDPAVRVPPLWSSGGRVDLLNQWVYAYPEPFRVAAVAGEQQAMASGCPGQRPGIMTQLIVKRFELIPAGMKVKKVPGWAIKEPNRPYITTPAGLLREAAWAMISRRVDSIMYYGMGALMPPQIAYTGLRFINPASAKVLTGIHNNVVKPLGPMLKILPERPADTAIYESFASSIFAGRGGWGWGHEWPSGMLMFRANLAPVTLYAEHVEKGALKDIKVLFMPHCDVLTANVVKELEKFQARGGIIIADRYLAPAVTPDILVDEVVFSSRAGAKAFKRDYQKLAAEVLKKLAPHYTPFVSADPEFLTFPRKYRDADYLFVINDKRRLGGDFGVWRQVMEVGLPHSGKVIVRRPAGAVYELSRGGSLPFVSKNGSTEVKLDYKTNDGRLLLFLDSPIGRVEVAAPECVNAGEEFAVSGRILDMKGKAVPALLPIEISVRDPEGRKLAGSGYFCAGDGSFNEKFLIGLNDRPGVWRIAVRDRASGLINSVSFIVRGKGK